MARRVNLLNDDEYLRFLISLVYDERYFSVSYNKLFKKLYDTEFVSVMLMDENRASDALKLRDGFGDICHPCSVLEVLIALSNRCEEQIMHNDIQGNRMGLWFWEMIGNIGLSSMDDNRYDEEYVNDILRRFLYHNYGSNGLGCAFRSASHPDLRDEELWYQMNYHLADILEV